jgi:hypothetical protein
MTEIMLCNIENIETIPYEIENIETIPYEIESNESNESNETNESNESNESKKLHIILDIDGTCISNHIDSEIYQCVNPNMILNEDTFGYHRPGLIEFLNKCFEKFASVSLWTAAGSIWMSKFIDSLPGSIQNKFIHTWSFKNCVKIQGIYVKPLQIMWNNEISKKIGMNRDNTIIVDDVEEVCIMNLDNHYHIKQFDYYDHNDNELESVYLFLEKINMELK